MAEWFDRLTFELVLRSSIPAGGKGGEANRIAAQRSAAHRSVGRVREIFAFFCSVHVFWSSLGRAVFFGTFSSASGTSHSGFSRLGAGRQPQRLSEDWAVPSEPHLYPCQFACVLPPPFAHQRVSCFAVRPPRGHDLSVRASCRYPGGVLSAWRRI